MSRVVAIVCCALVLTSCTRSSSSPRELVIVARGMTFVEPANSEVANPVISLRAGEHVKVVFRNEAPGLIHNFQIPAWKVRTDEIRAGQSAEVVFTVPVGATNEKYDCRPHAELMHGVVEVTAQ